MTIFYRGLHMRIWETLASNPNLSKSAVVQEVLGDAVDAEGNSLYDAALLHNGCLACVYAAQQTKGKTFICKNCPFKINDGYSRCMDGTYDAWKTLYDMYHSADVLLRDNGTAKVPATVKNDAWAIKRLCTEGLSHYARTIAHFPTKYDVVCDDNQYNGTAE